MNWPSRFPIPLMNSVFNRVPILGAGSICPGPMSITSCTESTNAPRIVVSLSNVASIMTILVCTVFSVFDMPNFIFKSTMGTTLPRRLITPRINSGVPGTFVMAVKSSTSRTFEIFTAKTSLSSVKVRYCAISVIGSVIIIPPPFFNILNTFYQHK